MAHTLMPHPTSAAYPLCCPFPRHYKELAAHVIRRLGLVGHVIRRFSLIVNAVGNPDPTALNLLVSVASSQLSPLIDPVTNTLSEVQECNLHNSGLYDSTALDSSGKKDPQSGICGNVQSMFTRHSNHYGSRAATSATKETHSGHSLWVEKFSMLASVLTSWFMEKAPELFTYQVSIV